MGGFGPQGLGILGRPAADSEDTAARFRDTLQLLGPVFASFGLYLATRPDLLPLADCLVLAAIPDRGAPVPNEQIRQTIRAALEEVADGGGAAQRFVKFDPEPFESRLLCQLHHGQLDNGDLVVVKLIDRRLNVEEELRLLPLLSDALAGRLSDPEQLQALIEDFRSALLETLDCRRAAEAIESLGHDTRDIDGLMVPKVYRELCSRNVLVTERLEGVRLDHYLAKCSSRTEPLVSGVCSVDGIVPDELARLMCDAWLRQAFDGTMLPVDLRPEHILLRSPTEFAVLDGTFVSLPRATKGNLLDYLVANATGEPGKALVGLLKELDSSGRRSSDATLDRRFRQVVAFRDGGWEDGGRVNGLADTLFAQWRLAATHGYRPLRHLVQFYRGTFLLASLARQLAPQRDSLLEGVKDLRMTKLLHDIGAMMEPSYWGGQADRLAALMVLGPRHLDDALKAVVRSGDARHEPRTMPYSPIDSWNSLLAALLALTTFSLLREQFSSVLAPSWSERLAATAFVVIGYLVIRLVVGSGGSATQ
jgi:ubiquinone biosynthesis protein